MPVPRLAPILNKIIKFEEIKCARTITLEDGSRYRAAISGRMKRLTSHPHARRVKDRSCHKATKEKTSTVLTILFVVPPRGKYMYLIDMR